MPRSAPPASDLRRSRFGSFSGRTALHGLAGLLALVVLLIASSATRADGSPNRAATASPESVVRELFPAADQVTAVTHALTADEAKQVESVSGVPLESRLITAWRAEAGGVPLGAGYLDRRRVRTHPAWVLVAVGPDGTAQAVRVPAFHEPPEYLPSAGWLDRLRGRPLDDSLWPGRDVDALTGATLSARAVTASLRRALALERVAPVARAVASGSIAP